MNLVELVAIDVHTHAEVSCRQPADANWLPFEEAANKYFKAGKRPTIAETIAYYRERKIGLVKFTVDSEFLIGNRRIPNQEVADAAAENSDMIIAFASIDPHKGKMGVREARELIAHPSWPWQDEALSVCLHKPNPLIAPDRWIKDFKEAGFKPEVHDLILKQNAIKALNLQS